MKQLVALAILSLSSAAQAQPGIAPPASQCSVTIARAPDDVRNVVESWVRAEPSCTVKLEVRIIPTAGGFYLLARDEFGRVRERVVPDAQSAGVLVASWMAADSHGGETPYDIRKPERVAPVAPPALGGEAMAEGSAPGLAPVIAAPAAPRQHRWLAIGGLLGMSDAGGGGVRVEYDWRARRMATFGMIASASRTGQEMWGVGPYNDSMAMLETFDAKVLGYLSFNWNASRWRFRSSLGAGIVYTAAELDTYDYTQSASGLFPTGEVSFAVSRDIGDNWSLSAGPIVSLYVQRYEVQDSGTSYYYSAIERRDLDVKMYLAARYRL